MAHKNIDKFDIDAEREAGAISDLQKIRPKNYQLRKTYMVDGERFPTGQRHRNVIQTAC